MLHVAMTIAIIKGRGYNVILMVVTTFVSTVIRMAHVFFTVRWICIGSPVRQCVILHLSHSAKKYDVCSCQGQAKEASSVNDAE